MTICKHFKIKQYYSVHEQTNISSSWLPTYCLCSATNTDSIATLSRLFLPAAEQMSLLCWLKERDSSKILSMYMCTYSTFIDHVHMSPILSLFSKMCRGQAQCRASFSIFPRSCLSSRNSFCPLSHHQSENACKKMRLLFSPTRPKKKLGLKSQHENEEDPCSKKYMMSVVAYICNTSNWELLLTGSHSLQHMTWPIAAFWYTTILCSVCLGLNFF